MRVFVSALFLSCACTVAPPQRAQPQPSSPVAAPAEVATAPPDSVYSPDPQAQVTPATPEPEAQQETSCKAIVPDCPLTVLDSFEQDPVAYAAAAWATATNDAAGMPAV